MRELDLLLSAFLEQHYEDLSAADQDSFEKLLNCTDDLLMRWLTERAVPSDPTVSRIVAKITASREP